MTAPPDDPDDGTVTQNIAVLRERLSETHRSLKALRLLKRDIKLEIAKAYPRRRPKGPPI